MRQTGTDPKCSKSRKADASRCLLHLHLPCIWHIRHAIHFRPRYMDTSHPRAPARLPASFTLQYRGRLDPPSVLRALCAGFKEGTEPPVCLTGGLNVDECATGKDDCWVGPQGQKACIDTFRGFFCMCPPGE
jgi:hypothetical protein